MATRSVGQAERRPDDRREAFPVKVSTPFGPDLSVAWGGNLEEMIEGAHGLLDAACAALEEDRERFSGQGWAGLYLAQLCLTLLTTAATIRVRDEVRHG